MDKLNMKLHTLLSALLTDSTIKVTESDLKKSISVLLDQAALSTCKHAICVAKAEIVVLEDPGCFRGFPVCK